MRRNVPGTLFSLGLAVAVGLGAVAYSAGESVQAKDAPKTAKTETETSGAKTPAAAEVRIVTLGDSITKGVRAGVKAEETFPVLLEEALVKAGIRAKVTNVGRGGEETEGALKRLESDVLALKPQIVVVMYGTNDSYVYRGKETPRISEKQFADNTRAIVTKLKKGGVTPILMTAPCWGKKGRNGAGNDPNYLLGKYMDRTRIIARETGVPLVDNFAVWQAQLKKGVDIGQQWTTDQYHPNPVGHFMIAETMLPTVTKLAREHAKKLPLKSK